MKEINAKVHKKCTRFVTLKQMKVALQVFTLSSPTFSIRGKEMRTGRGKKTRRGDI